MTGEPLGGAVAFGAGLLSFLSPCVLPLVPTYLSFLTGMSIDDLAAGRTGGARRRALGHACGFVAGFSLVFLTLGASVGLVGGLLVGSRHWVARAGGVLIIALGLYLAGVFRFGALGRTRRLEWRGRPAGYLGAVLVGVTFGAGWTPCVGPILGAILTLAGGTDAAGRGLGLLAAYSAGLGVPFLASALALGTFMRLLARWQHALPHVERATGVLLVAVGLLVVTDYYTVLNGWAISLTPAWLLRRL